MCADVVRWSRVLVILLLGLFARSVHAQGTAAAQALTGVVLEEETGEPLAGATVVVVGTATGSATDAEGRFVLPRLAPGTYTLEAAMLGFDPVQRTITLEAGAALDPITFRLGVSAVPLREVVVTPGRFTVMEVEATAAQTLSRDEIQNLPQLGEDIYRAVRRLPGLSGNDFSAQLNIRGGEAREVGVLVDGLLLYEPFHLKDIANGALSILDVEAIGGIDMMTGAFPASYGNRLSGVFSLDTVEPPPGGRRTSAGVSFTNLRFLSEGRFAQDRGSWMVLARRGYLDLVFALLDEEEAPSPTYYDVLAKATYRLNNRHRLSMHLLQAEDDLTFDDGDDQVDTGYGNAYGWLTWEATLTPRVFVRTLASVGRVTTNRRGRVLTFFNDQSFTERVDDDRSFSFVGLKQDWTVELSTNQLVQGGFEVRPLRASYDYATLELSGPVGVEGPIANEIQVDRAPSGTEVGAYLSYRVRPLRALTVEGGLRFDRASWADDAVWSPRLNAAYRLNRQLVVRAGWGLFYQSQGVEELQVEDGDDRFYPAEQAQHQVVGLEYTLGQALQVRVEGYRKLLSDLRPRYLSLEDASTDLLPELGTDRFRAEPTAGRAQGVEVLLRTPTQRTVAWSASYGYAVTELDVNGVTVPRSFDQRHTLYLDATYRPTQRWRLSAAWQFHSGWPYTGRVFQSIRDENGTVIGVQGQYGPYNEERFPAYHRMDLRVHRYFSFSRSQLSVFFEVSNLYNRANPRQYFFNVVGVTGAGTPRVRRFSDDWLPRLPSLGLSWELTR